MIKFVATKNQSGQKLIQLIKKILLKSDYNEIQKYFRTKKIKVNNTYQEKNYIIKEKDIILIFSQEKLKTF
ncbi:RNA pseudouridine synthase, partial [Mesomycoplasma hyopneumoniae]